MNSHTTIPKIIAKNVFTLFNIVNIILAVMVALVGSYKNMLFIVIALANTLISIINEIRAKKIIDKMRLIAEQKPTVIREGKAFQLPPEDVVKGDIIVYGLGDQVLFDSEVTSGDIEVNESFITGESDNITKHPGDKLISGSFVVSGTCQAKVTASLEENFVNKLESSAKTIKTADSKLFKLMNNIVKYISYTLIPIGALLLWARFRVPGTTPEVAVTSTVAGLINMIPEGLILLTSSILALATIRLSRKKVLVQDLYSIETLARVDCICLDKTGTITTGNMKVQDIMPAEGADKNALQNALELIFSHIPADNATSKALAAKFARRAKNRATDDFEIIPFSSERKYSGVRTQKATYLIGAPEFLTKNKDYLKQARSLAGPYRTLMVMKIEGGTQLSFEGIPEPGKARISARAPWRRERATRPEKECECRIYGQDPSGELLGFVRLADDIRGDAHEIIKYFYTNNVEVKIISGDAPETVESIARTVGVKNPQAIDLSTTENINYDSLVKNYNIFTRVKPSQKKSLVRALKKQGKTVAMTGDGVNDILAMKEADCSISIGDGSDAARRTSKIVLLNSDFAAVPAIINEGRQSINNLERSTTLFLAKTVYASILAILFVFLPFNYPFTPIEMSLLNFACIGFPAFILALEYNTDRIKNRFTKNIVQYSFPVGLTVSLCMIALSIAAHLQGFSHHELTTASLFITFTIDILLIYWISRPLNHLRRTLLIVIIGIIITVFAVPFFRDFFEFIILSQNGLFTTIFIIIGGIAVFEALKYTMRHLAAKFLAS